MCQTPCSRVTGCAECEFGYQIPSCVNCKYIPSNIVEYFAEWSSL